MNNVVDGVVTEEDPTPLEHDPVGHEGRTLRWGDNEYPVVLPKLRDPRLHLAAVIISIHVLGQVALGFHVSVPQILVAIGTCFVIEVMWTFAMEARLVWPASAMLTGSGVALILRSSGTDSNDHWSFDSWQLFALVAGLSLVTKYVIRYRGSHVFNPSNVGLVATFLLLGSSRVEPLDFWWGPLDAWMVMAFWIIIVGGLLITSRVAVLEMGAWFWLTLAVGLGILAASGHCMTARWSLRPICGLHFWWVVVTSPETLIFLFFMLGDPKTVPESRKAKVRYGVIVGAVCTLLIAPQSTEFGAKVALLGGLTVCSAGLAVARRFAPTPGPDKELQEPGLMSRRASKLVISGLAMVVFASAVVLAGAPARGSGIIVSNRLPDATGVLPPVDVSTMPEVTVEPLAVAFDSDMEGDGARELAARLAWILQVETELILRGDSDLLRGVTHGQRLEEAQQAIDEAAISGRSTERSYTYEEMHLVVANAFSQTGGRLAFEATGTILEVVRDEDDLEIGRTTTPFSLAFVMLGATEDRWRLVDTLPLVPRL